MKEKEVLCEVCELEVGWEYVDGSYYEFVKSYDYGDVEEGVYLCKCCHGTYKDRKGIMKKLLEKGYRRGDAFWKTMEMTEDECDVFCEVEEVTE